MKNTPLFGMISKNGKRFSVYFHTQTEPYTATGITLEGYSIDTFKDAPEDLPVIDLTAADESKILKVILYTDGILEHHGHGIAAQEYLNKFVQAGGQLTTVGELRRFLEMADHSEEPNYIAN